jgi:hypothetical protein
MPTPMFRERVECALPARMMYAVTLMDVFAFAPDREEEGRAELERLRKLLTTACLEPLDGLPPPIKAIVGKTIDRAHGQVMAEYDQQRADKVSAAIFYFLKDLTDSGYLELWEGSPVAEAAAIYTPMVEHVFGEERLDASAQKQAKRILTRLQERGYYT